MSHGWVSLSPALSCPEVSVLSLAEPVSASVLDLVVLGWVAGTLQTHALPSQPRFAPLRVSRPALRGRKEAWPYRPEPLSISGMVHTLAIG